ncbi:fibrocystin-L-like [Antedon mediterranea]|uniref:fibrocystin-L-like n=1 Tax=Antedon mediterranea TaxID=105859 RepID=UPI003AF7F6A5
MLRVAIIFLTAYLGLAVRVYDITPRRGSLEGGTEITINGIGFSEDPFNFGEGNEHKGNLVYLNSSTSIVQCDVIAYKTTTKKIICETRAAIPGYYTIYVLVDGVEGHQCNYGSCTFQYRDDKTPKISKVYPRAGTPDSPVRVDGFIVSDVVTDVQTQSEEYEESNTNIELKRVFMDASICDLINQTSGTVYGIDKASNGWGSFYCKPNSTVVDSKKVSFLVTSEYGHSYTYTDALTVSYTRDIYLFQLYTDVTSVSPNTGSLAGGTILTIEGNYFGGNIEQVDVKVGGVACEVLEVTDTVIKCRTGPQPANQTTYPGNRGMFREVWNKTSVHADFSNANFSTTTSDYFSEIIDEFSSPEVPSFGETDYYYTRYTGYFVAPYTGEFRLLVDSDDQSQLLFSMSENPDNLTKIAYVTGWSSNYYKYPEQVSELLNLVGGNRYYVKAIQREGGGGDHLRVGLLMYDLPFNHSDLGGASDEKQVIAISSVVQPEVQVIKFDVGNSTAINNFVLTLDGVDSDALSSSSSAEDVRNAILKMAAVKCTRTEGGNTYYAVDYEETPAYHTGNLVRDTEPYCGHVSLRSPGYVFCEGRNEDPDGEDLEPFRVDAFQWICFAYKGGISNKIRFRVNWDYDGSRRSDNRDYYIDGISSSTSWQHTCFQVVEYINNDGWIGNSATEGTHFEIERITLNKEDGADEFYIDMFEIAKQEVRYDRSEEPARPNDILITDVTVEKSPSEFRVQFYAADCGTDYPLLGIKDATVDQGSTSGNSVTFSDSSWPASETITVERVTAASSPVTGNIKISWKGKITGVINMETTASQMKTILEDALDTGTLNVEKSGDCLGYSWTVEWLQLGGNHPAMEFTETALNGNEVEATVTTEIDGAVTLSPIPGDYLRTPHWTPQVEVTVNGIISSCSEDDCEFVHDEEYTAIITGIDTHSGSNYDSTSITISGSGFGTDQSDVEVTIDEAVCEITSLTSSEIMCDVGKNTAGEYEVKVYIAPDGYALSGDVDVSFNYTVGFISINPSSGSPAGGTKVTITGYGFSDIPDENTVYIGDNECIVSQSTYDEINCTIGHQEQSRRRRRSSNELDINIGTRGQEVDEENEFTEETISATIASLAPTTSSVTGGGVLTINGNDFGTDSVEVKINGNACVVTSQTNTVIQCTIPANDPGEYTVTVTLPAGDIDSDLTLTYDLEVTGVFPDHGSLQGGTKVFITGSGFGTNGTILSVEFGETECEITDVQDDLIECTSGPSGTTHQISNNGKHKDYGVGYAWTQPSLSITAGDVVEWTWSTPSLLEGVGYTVQQTADEASETYDGQGFYAGASSKKGSFSFTFSTNGTFYYTSGVVNSNEDEEDQFSLHGVIRVEHPQSKAQNIKVSLNDIEALYDTSANPSAPTDSSNCPGDDDLITPCSDTEPDCESSDKFCFKYRICSTASISDIGPISGSTDTTITISGFGFSPRNCDNDVHVGSHVCDVTSSTKSSIECTIETEDTLQVGYLHEVSVNVKNQGLALNEIKIPRNQSFLLTPSISAISPTSGSLAGGTELTITGDGFSADNADEIRVTIGQGRTCVIQTFTYTEIICTTPAQWQDEASFPIVVTINFQDSNEDFMFTYRSSKTPNVVGLSPSSISGSSSTVTFTGSGFGTDVGDISVTIGDINCDVDTVSDTQITCNIGYVPFGTKPVSVKLDGSGLANFTDGTIWADKVIDSVSPAQGSRYGGTVITITGSGFYEDSTSVRFDNKNCVVQSVNVSTIVCITENHSAGTIDFTVTSNDVQFPVQVDGYTYDNDYTPKITAVAPSSGASGDTITITGTLFGTNAANVVVKIGNEECDVNSVTATEIQCDVPSQPAGVYDVDLTVYNLGSAVTSTPHTFAYNLTITDISPDDGSFAGKKNLTITGSGFNGDSSMVTVCGNPCEVLSGTFTSLVCLLPANENIASELACDVVVSVSDDTTETQSNGFTYKQSLTATITSVSPARGGTAGGTEITISGTGFKSSGNVVTIAGSACVISSETTTSIVCTTEGHDGSIKTHVRVVTDNEENIATQDNAEYYYVDVWSSRWTWGGHDPPIAGDFVIVPAGQTLLLDVTTPVLAMLLIQGGSFIFDEADIELHAENILIMDGGLLQVGTEQEPFQHKATIMMHGHQRSLEIPLYGAKTLAVRNGTLDLHGIPIPVTWTYLAETAEVGATTLDLEKPVSWNVGDQIVIASTGERHSQRENEMVEITAISNDGTQLTIDPALKYEHISIEQTIDGVLLSTKAEVGVLTRNVVVRGSVQSEWTETIEACDAKFDTNQFATQTCYQGRFGEEIGSDQFGSQIMLFGKHKNQQLVTGRIEYVEVTHAGQAFRLGRYPIHFHLNGDVSGSYVRGCGIHHTFNRAVTIHAVDNLLVEHNVAFDIMGHAYFMEDGIEMGNIIQYNLGVFVKSSSSLLNVDITPAAFWLTNPNNTIRHNAAAGGSHFGFWYQLFEHPAGPSYTPDICPRKMVMGEFTNNTAHSQGWYGLWIFPVYTPMVGGQCDSTTPAPAKFYDFTAWNVERGAEVIDVGGVQFHNFLIADADQAGIEYQKVVSGTPFDEDGALIKDSVVIGYSQLTEGRKNTSCTKAGVHAPKSKGLTIDGVKFINFDQKCCAAFRSCAHCKPDQGGFEARIKNLEFSNSPNKVFFMWEHEFWYEDLDGTLTGSANSIVTPHSGNLPSDHCTEDDAYSVGKPGASCDDTIKLHRMSFNEVAPSSLQYKDAVFTNAYGTSSVPYHLKRITHPEGWMVTLIDGETYNMFFEFSDHVTNITYNARFDGFNDGEFVILNHNLTQSPDHFETAGVSRNNSKQMITYSNNAFGDWHFDNENNDLYYLVSGKDINEVEGANLNVQLRVYRCYYDNCIEPVPTPPPEFDLDDSVLWSDVSTWEDAEEGWGWNVDGGSAALPADGEDVMIPEDKYVFVDTETPVMNKLYIYGALELQAGQSHRIEAKYIFVTGALIIGRETTPFEDSVEIILHGNHFTQDLPLPSGPNMGSKVLGVFGRLDLHGQAPNVPWTKLASTADVGSDTITLVHDVDWAVEQEIVITATSYEAWETETFKITEVIDAKTLRLNDTVRFKHIAETTTIEDGLTYTEAAEVGLLSRNIKIIGADYNDLYEESFGARVLIGKFQQDGNEYKGYARISNVEFYHTGQEGWPDNYDPRYSVAFLDTGEVTVANPSYVRECAFHHGFSPAIGVFGAFGVHIEDNVIHHTVGAGISAWGSRHVIAGNLVSLTVFPGTYQERFLKEDKTWPAGIEIQNAFSTVIANNTVAGSERLLYRVGGEDCFEDALWVNNEGHSALAGVMILPTDSQHRCSRINGFFLWKNYYYGIYLETTSSLVVSDVTLADNKIGILPYIYRPPALSHEPSSKTFTMESSTIIGTSPSFSCSELQNAPENEDQCNPVHSPPNPPGGGKIGFMMTNFMSGSNNAPIKAFHGIKNYPAIAGLTQLQDVKFAYFQEGCSSSRDYAMVPNPGNQDGIHPTTVEETSFANVDETNKLFIFNPSVGKANPADCVDMSCDAMRKIMITDKDGSFVGNGPGTIIANSGYEWDGDPRYGLGDYRIPKMALTNTDGSRISAREKFPKKGIVGVGTDKCEWNADWNAYKCHQLDHAMMIIESMDPDTEVRRLSPIAMCSEDTVDLINGPQDHGWCHGYTCQERISTFMSIVATGKTYEMYMSSTNPQHLRLHLLNSNDDQKVVVGIWYANPQRLDVYHQGRYVMPNNGGTDRSGSFIWVDKDPNLPDDQFQPKPTSNIYGGNYFDRERQTLWVLVRGGDSVDIITTPVVMVAIGVPAVSVDDFFEENLVQNLANLLGISSDRIRVVDVIREGSTRRRRRSDEVTVEIEIGDQPATNIDVGNSTSNSNLTDTSYGNYTAGNSSLGYDDLLDIQSQIADAAQTGELSESLDVEVQSLAMSDPVEPATDPTGGERATNETGGPDSGDMPYGEVDSEEEEPVVEVVYQFPSYLMVSQQPSDASRAWPFVVEVSVLDAQGELVLNLGHSSNPWKMEVSLRSGTGPEGSMLTGNTTIGIVNGVASFTEAMLDTTGSGYILDFAIVYPNTSTLAPVSSQSFSVAEREFEVVVGSQPNVSVTVGERFTVGFSLADVLSGLQLADLDSYGYNWTASIELYEPDNYFGSLTGNKTTVIDLALANGMFTDLSIDGTGFQYIMEITLTTTTSSSYMLTKQLTAFDVVPASIVVHTGEPMEVTLSFLANYASYASGKEENVKINFLNKFSNMYTNVTFTVESIYEGSIRIDFTMVGDVDNTVATMYNDLQAGRITLFIDGTIIEADKYYMKVNGESYGPSDDEEDSGIPVWAIVLLVLILLILLIVMVFTIHKFFSNKQNNKLAAVETMHLTEKEEAPRISSRADLHGRNTPVFTIETPEGDFDETKPLKDDTSRPSSSRSKSPGFNHPSRTPEIVSTALPPGFAQGSEEHLKEDRATMFIMQLMPNRSFSKLGEMDVNLVGPLSNMRAELKPKLASLQLDQPFVLLTETLKDIDGASEKRQIVHEVYASDSILLRFLDDKDIDKLCVCGLVGQFECSLCHAQVYCSPQCQSGDWAKHIQTCNSGKHQSPDSSLLYNEKEQKDSPPISYP